MLSVRQRSSHSTSEQPWRVNSAANAAAAVAVAVGVSVLIAWALGVDEIGGLNGTVRMKANTAASFVLLGLSIASLAPKRTGRRRKRVRIGLRDPGGGHLSVSDLAMPNGINGRELALRLRARSPGLKVLFTSGYSQELFGQPLVLEEGEQFLQKPFQASDLLSTARRCLDSPG